MLKIAIDESGTIGKKERYFIIAAIIFHDEGSKKRVKNLVRNTKNKLAKGPGKELKGSAMSTTQKQKFLSDLSNKKDYSVAYIAADKEHINPTLYAQKNLTFNFLFGLLLKSFISEYGEDLDICIDNRTVKVNSTNSLADYIKIEAYAKWGFRHKLYMHLEDSKSDNHLQATDIVANSVYAKYNYGKNHLYSYNAKHFVRKEHFPFAKFSK